MNGPGKRPLLDALGGFRGVSAVVGEEGPYLPLVFRSVSNLWWEIAGAAFAVDVESRGVRLQLKSDCERVRRCSPRDASAHAAYEAVRRSLSTLLVYPSRLGLCYTTRPVTLRHI